VLPGNTGGSAGDVTRVGIFARDTESGYKEHTAEIQYREENGRRARVPSFKPVAYVNTGGVREFGCCVPSGAQIPRICNFNISS